MTVKELFEEIEKFKKDNPTLDIDSMEIGPVFNGGSVMYITKLTIEEDAGWGTKDAIGIIWHC